MSEYSKYTIGWICAITPELLAARLHLDAEHTEVEHKLAPNDNNAYVFGHIGKHNIVIASLPKGQYGITSAANVAKDLIRSFPDVRIGLMVGIAGGAPLLKRNGQKEQDIRLGDIVISVPENGRGGVYQFDLGKAKQGQEFLLTGHLNSPPPSLLAAMSVLETDPATEERSIDDDISSLLAKHKKLQKRLRRPDPETDRLFKSSYVHLDDAQDCSSICDDKAQIHERPARDDYEEAVMIHYGLIASTNTLMKDAEARDTFAREHGVLCFEMEAAGLMNQLPFLVIRGICDYSDSHKNKIWQGYAALTAAAYAKRLLLRLAPSEVEAEMKLSKVMQDVHQGIQQVKENFDLVRTHLEHQEVKGLQKEIEKWLKAPDQLTNHKKAIHLHHDGTGSWVLDSYAFKQWQHKQIPLLWLYGISGCGKTVLISTIIEHLTSSMTQSELVLYFYFDVQDTQKQRLDNLLRCLIKQLCPASFTTPDHLQQLYTSCKRGDSQPTTSQLECCFEALCSGKDIIIILDALDECHVHEAERQTLLAWVKKISINHNTRIIVTSRPLHDIKRSFTELTSNGASIQLNHAHMDQDIKTFVHFTVHHDQDLIRRWEGDPNTQNLIERSLIEKANGMFRWVFCQIDSLKRCTNRPLLERALSSLPTSLYETYAQILRRIPEDISDYTIRLLQFLTYAERPLTLEEAVDALAVRPDKPVTFQKRDREPDPEDIAIYCASLTQLTTRQITSYDGDVTTVREIQLAHPSVREYFQSGRLEERWKGDFELAKAKSCIVQVCLAYLYQVSQTPEEYFPFRIFAARYWMDHAPIAEKDGKDVLEWIHKVFTSKQLWECWLKSYDPNDSNAFWLGSMKPGALYYASLGGLTKNAARLMKEGADINAPAGMYGSALQAASARGHTEIVKLLLDRGADINAQGGEYGSALYLASAIGHTEIMKLLLDRGVNLNAEGGMYGSALQAASAEGHTEIVKQLLDRGADLNTEGGEYGSALQAASARGHTEIVKLLLDRGADINAQGGEYGSALRAVSAIGHTEIVELLLDRDADINAEDDRYGSALYLASAIGHTEIVKLLLDRGADPNAEGGTYGSALQAASAEGHTEIVKQLLDSGADINAQGGEHGSALYLASAIGHTEIVELLRTQQSTHGLG